LKQRRLPDDQDNSEEDQQHPSRTQSLPSRPRRSSGNRVGGEGRAAFRASLTFKAKQQVSALPAVGLMAEAPAGFAVGEDDTEAEEDSAENEEKGL
jgi:hypothetical protein